MEHRRRRLLEDDARGGDSTYSCPHALTSCSMSVKSEEMRVAST